MAKASPKKTENITLSQLEYKKLLEVYKKLGEILTSKKKKRGAPSLETLYGICKGAKVNEKDFKEVEKSLFGISP